MIRLRRSKVQPIGVDLGLDSVKMLQLEVVDQSLSVIAASRQSLPEEARQQPELHLPVAMEIVRQALRQGGFSGKHVIVSLPRRIVHVKNLRLPMMPRAEIESAVQFEARNIFPFDVDQAMVRHILAGEVRQGNESRLEVIALAAKQQDVTAFLEQLHRCGCVVESLDIEPAAIYRGVERFIRRREDEAEVHLLVDIGLAGSRVVIGRGHEVSFYKPIEIGGQNLNEAVSRKLEITLEEARVLRRRLAESGEAGESAGKPDPVRQAVFDATRSTIEELGREISLCLRYYSVTFRGQRPNRLRLVGAEAGDPPIQSILTSVLPVPVEPARPLYSVDTSRMKQSDRRGFMSEWAVAFGLGLKLAEGHFGARDGKKRDVSAQGAAAAGASVEVIDLSAAVSGGDARGAASLTRAEEAREAAHA